MGVGKIVVGVDFSETSQAAVRHAMAVARKHGAEVVLLHMCGVPSTPAIGDGSLGEVVEGWDAILEQRLAGARRRLEDMRESHDGQGPVVSHMVREDQPAEGLVDAAAELGADMIVVGTHGYTGVKRFLLGSIAERVVRRAACSVMVARGRPPTDGYRNILVPTGFGPLADAAASNAISLAETDGGVELLHCWSMPSLAWAAVDVSLSGGEQLWRAMSDNVRDQLDDLAGRHRSPRVDLTTRHVEANARLGIQERLADGDFDLVVMGSHVSADSEWPFGSVASATVRHAPCSVLIVRDGGGAAR